MTDHDKELAREILDLHFHKPGEIVLAPMIKSYRKLEEAIAQALRSVRQSENEACAKVADETEHVKTTGGFIMEFDRPKYQDHKSIATAIRNRMKEKP